MTNFCKDCKFYKRPIVAPPKGMPIYNHDPVCLHPSAPLPALFLVSGSDIHRESCFSMRLQDISGDTCGLEGKWFEPKEEKE